MNLGSVSSFQPIYINITLSPNVYSFKVSLICQQLLFYTNTSDSIFITLQRQTISGNWKNESSTWIVSPSSDQEIKSSNVFYIKTSSLNKRFLLIYKNLFQFFF